MGLELYFTHTLRLRTEERLRATLSGVLADLGGVLGLWFGASIMSLLHVWVYVVRMWKFRECFCALLRRL